MKGQVTGKMFALMRFGYVEVLFYMFYYTGVKKIVHYTGHFII